MAIKVYGEDDVFGRKVKTFLVESQDHNEFVTALNQTLDQMTGELVEVKYARHKNSYGFESYSALVVYAV